MPAEGVNPLAELMDEFLAQYMRANQVFFTCCFQFLLQLPQDLQQTILRLRNQFVGRTGTLSEAKIWADEILFKKDPMQVKHYQKVWAHEPIITSHSRSVIGTNHFVLDYEPKFMPLPEQLEVASRRLVELPRFSFFVRPATAEGSVSTSVGKITIKQVTEDPETKKPVFPNETLLQRLKSCLAKRSGIPAATIRKEIDARLRMPDVQPLSQPLPAAAEDRGSKPSRLPAVQPATLRNDQHPEQSTAKIDPSLPTLNEQEQALLALITKHPADTPVSSVYKRLSLSWRAGNQLRDSLITRGYLTEIETRAGKVGRPTKVLLPTFSAFALLGKDPPPGRGGAVHRHIQQVVAAGARAKGYTAKLEHELGNGGIVDVHLERGGGEKIAVEIAVMSHPRRELAHIRQYLDAGYDKVVTIFADPRLLERTREASTTVFSETERSRIQLMPISKIAGVG